MVEKHQNRQAPVTTPRMPPSAVEQLLVYLLRSARIFDAAKEVLRPEYFQREPHFRLLWKAILVCRTGSTEGLTYDEIYITTSDLLEADQGIDVELRASLIATPGDVGVELYENVANSPVIERPGLIYHAFHSVNPDELKESFGLALLKRFLSERSVADTLREIGQAADDKVRQDYTALIRELQTKTAQIESVGSSPILTLEEAEADAASYVLESTGITHFDELMHGGTAAGEVYMIFGPYKSGKSFHALELMGAAAERYYYERLLGGPHRVAYYFSYELSAAEVFCRVMSRMAGIKLPRLLYRRSQGITLSRTGHLLDYEKKMYAAKGITDPALMLGEQERYDQFKATIAQHVRIADLRGMPRNGMSAEAAAKIGTGGIDEIVQLLRRELDTGVVPSNIAIDYVNRVVDANLNARGLPSRELRGMIQTFVRQSFSKLAVPFNLPVWLMQQYSAEGNDASPTKRPSSTQGSESKTLGADVSMSFCQGKLDEETKVALFYLELSRRTPNSGEERLFHLAGEDSRWSDVTKLYECIRSGPGSGTIRMKGEQASKKSAGGIAKVAINVPSKLTPDIFKADAQASLQDPV